LSPSTPDRNTGVVFCGKYDARILAARPEANKGEGRSLSAGRSASLTVPADGARDSFGSGWGRLEEDTNGEIDRAALRE
jgi:hypothetical protein